MRKAYFEVLIGGETGTTPEQPRSNPGDFGKRTAGDITSAAEPHLRVRKVVDGAEFAGLVKSVQRVLADPNTRKLVWEFAKDASVPSSEKFFVMTVQRLKKPLVTCYLLEAKSHAEAEAAAMADSQAKGLDPMRSYSAHLSLALIAG